jgi:hypothetical protein
VAGEHQHDSSAVCDDAAMHRAWRGRAAAAALTASACGLLVGCNPPPGQAALTLTGAVEADDPAGAVTCRPPGDGGETTIPSWEWNGTIDGEATLFAVSSQSGPTPDMSVLHVGTRYWTHFPGGAGNVVLDRVDHDGTLHATATLRPLTGTGDVEVTASLRCPGWGHSTLAGAVAGTLDGVPACDVPSGSDAYATYAVPSANLPGQLQASTLSFAGLAGPSVDTALLRHAGVTWGATNQPGQPPQIESSIDGEGVLSATASLRRLDGRPGTVDVDAVIRCP